MEEILITDILASYFIYSLAINIENEKNRVRAVQESCWSDDNFSTVRRTTKTKKIIHMCTGVTQTSFSPIFF